MSKITKKVLSTVLCIVIMTGIAPLNGFVGLKLPDINLPKLDYSWLTKLFVANAKAETVTSGKCGEHLSWNYDQSDKILSITGNGDMYDYEEGESPWFDFCKNIKEISIDNNVTSIGNFAFLACDIKNIIIPNSVKRIGDGAFLNCYSLTEAIIGDGCLNIGISSFGYCSKLNNVDWGNNSNVRTIANHAFEFCENLSEITIPDSVESIGVRLFTGCFSLKNITFGERITTIPAYFIEGCDIENLYIKSKTSITFDGGALYTMEDHIENLYIGDINVDIDNGIQWGSVSNIYYGGSQQKWENRASFYSEDFAPNQIIPPTATAKVHFLADGIYTDVVRIKTDSDFDGLATFTRPDNHDVINLDIKYNNKIENIGNSVSISKDAFQGNYDVSFTPKNLSSVSSLTMYLYVPDQYQYDFSYSIDYEEASELIQVYELSNENVKAVKTTLVKNHIGLPIWYLKIENAAPGKYILIDSSKGSITEKRPESIKNYVSERNESYKTTITFTSQFSNIPEGATVHWFINGKDKGTGETYTVKNATRDYTVQVKLIDNEGNILAESEIETVKIKSSFIARLIAFFKQLIRKLPVIEQ